MVSSRYDNRPIHISFKASRFLMRSALRNTILIVLFGGIAGGLGLYSFDDSKPPLLPHAPSPSGVRPRTATEEHWIVEGAVNAIAGMVLDLEIPSARAIPIRGVEGSSPSFRVEVNATTQPLTVIVAEHIWSPHTYEAVADQLLRASTSAGIDSDHSDLSVRSALTNLNASTLLDVNDRVSATLEQHPRSAAAHESAALLVGAFALRESVGLFADVRPALTQMAAHLAIAEALRPSAEETLDGTCARGVLAALAGLQRHALAIASDIDRKAVSESDHAWARALTLRVTGDWRNRSRVSGETPLEQLEYARALRSRRGDDAFLDYLDTLSDAEGAADSQRIAFNGYFNVEASQRFADQGIDRELGEAHLVWSRYHPGDITEEGLIARLNDRPSATPVRHIDGRRVVRVLDWGMWAAFEQRHLCHAMTALAYNLWNRADEDAQNKLASRLSPVFGDLTLYPVVLRWIARTPDDYDRALARARILVTASPEVVPAAAWNFLLKQPAYVDRPRAFPSEAAWFEPAVPTGTAFDLGARSLRAGCPRPPSLAQAAVWAQEMPYDHWTQWAHAYFAAGKGVPSLPMVRRAFGQLLEYDEGALMKVIEYTQMSRDERIVLTRSLCTVSTSRCPLLTELLLLENQELEAVKVYEKWFANARDRVNVANEMLWLVRYYVDHGNTSRAETIARDAAGTGSARGMEVFAEFLDRSKRYEEAERFYRKINDTYTNHATPFGAYLMRRGLATDDSALQQKAADLLHESFPGGLQRVVAHALPAEPANGVSFATFGKRAAAAGLEPGDVIVAVDGWRVASTREYAVAARLAFDPTMTLTVWRSGRYRQLTANVPQRWLGCRLKNFGS
jgi:hypothetical protein